ncbi:hypothetical protein L6452_05511 [Arctium lappa]|uniref:Uncharacterized protein n=1 Tax=Arctium lappa TaxID=4217 RepID=A0ACB9EGL1_ARCLA|nr:hypothetical protein L6452_05511 [Arctium lappa]
MELPLQPHTPEQQIDGKSAVGHLPEVSLPIGGNEETQNINGDVEHEEVPRNVLGNDDLNMVGRDSLKKGHNNNQIPNNLEGKENVQDSKNIKVVGHNQEMENNYIGLNKFSGKQSGPEFMHPNKEIINKVLDDPIEGTIIDDHGGTEYGRETGNCSGETTTKAGKGKSSSACGDPSRLKRREIISFSRVRFHHLKQISRGQSQKKRNKRKTGIGGEMKKKGRIRSQSGGGGGGGKLDITGEENVYFQRIKEC